MISNLAPPDPFHLLLARARQEATDMTWAQDVGGAKRLRVMANAWVLCCGAEEAAAQPGSGGGVPHTPVKPNSGSRAGRQPRKRRRGPRDPPLHGETERL